MRFFEIQPVTIPTFKFAYSVEIGKFRHSFNRVKDFLELCVLESGSIEQRHADGRTERIYPKMFSPLFCTDICTALSVGEGINRHTTVGVAMQYTFKRYDSESECNVADLKRRMKENFIILVPYHEDISEIYDKAISIIKSIGISLSSESPAEKGMALSRYFALTSLLTDFVLRRLDDAQSVLPPSEVLYASKAEGYINESYAKKLTVEDIADFLEISSGYLQHIFRHVTGMTVVDYINSCRVTNAIKLMQSRGLSLKEASLNVGVSDPAYMSRLFRKVTGLSCREYMGRKFKE